MSDADLTLLPTDTDTDIIDPNSLPLLDGQAFDLGLVTREVHHHTEAMIVSAFQLGRLLSWAKSCLRHGQFEEWVSHDLPFSERTARRYMQLHHFLEGHPGLLKPLARAGLKKALLLTTLPPDVLEQLEEGAQVPELDLEGIADVPYSTLKKDVARLTKERDEAQAEAAQTKEKLRDAGERLLDVDGILNGDDKKTVDRIRQAKVAVERALLGQTHQVFDHIAYEWDELTAPVQAEVMSFYEWLDVLCRHEVHRFRLVARDIPPAVYDHFVQDCKKAHKTHSTYDFPEGRRVPYFDEEGDGDKGKGKGGAKG